MASGSGKQALVVGVGTIAAAAALGVLKWAFKKPRHRPEHGDGEDGDFDTSLGASAASVHQEQEMGSCVSEYSEECKTHLETLVAQRTQLEDGIAKENEQKEETESQIRKLSSRLKQVNESLKRHLHTRTKIEQELQEAVQASLTPISSPNRKSPGRETSPDSPATSISNLVYALTCSHRGEKSRARAASAIADAAAFGPIQDALRDHGAIQELSSKLTSPSPDVQVQCARALANLAVNVVNQREMSSLGAVKSLSDIVQNRNTTVETTRFALQAIMNLCLSEVNSLQFRDLGITTFVCSVVRNQHATLSHDVRVHNLCSRILVNMSTSPTLHGAILASRILEAGGYLESEVSGESGSSRLRALTFTANLSTSADCAEAILISAIPDTLNYIVSTSIGSDDEIQQALRAIDNLEKHSKECEKQES